MDDLAVNINNMTKIYRGNIRPVIVFDNFSIAFKQGKISAVIGPSGCGKSTLLRMIAGLDKPTHGEISFGNEHPRVSMIFQEKALFPWLTVERNIRFGLELGHVPRELHEDISNYWLEKVGLSRFSSFFPDQLSGGMKQKLALARCMALKPDIVLMDEPFGSLDNQSRLEIMTFCEHLFFSQDTTIILVTHNVQEAIYLADTIIGLPSMPVANSACLDISAERPRSVELIKSPIEIEIERALSSKLLAQSNVSDK